MEEDKNVVYLPTYDYAFKNYNYRLMMILLYDFTYTQPCGDNPYKRLDKYRYKRFKKEMITKYKKTDRSWNRDFKKMIELGFIKEETDHYKIYNRNPIANDKGRYEGFRTFSRSLIEQMINDDLTTKEIRAFIFIFYQCYDWKSNSVKEKHIVLEYIAEVFGTSKGHHSFRDYIGYRPCEHNYEYDDEKKIGILSRLEEMNYIKIRKQKNKYDNGNFNINNYFFIPLLR